MQRAAPTVQKQSKTRSLALWVSVSYCPGATWFIDMYGPKDITRHVHASRHEAEKAKNRIDELGCGGGCQLWHMIEYATPTERQNYPHIIVYDIERSRYRAYGMIIPARYADVERALTHNVHGMPTFSEEKEIGNLLIPSMGEPGVKGKTLRFAILKRDMYRCRLCGISAKDGDHVRLEVDHITPRARGGNNDPSNLWTLCFACNRGKGIKEL